MNRLVFLVEEPSIKVLLDGLLPRLFPTLDFKVVEHEGKSDLEKSIPRKLRGWQEPGIRFVVLMDADNKDCIALKQKLAKLCAEAGRPDTLIRIVCQELEAWYIGDPEALAAAYDDTGLRTIGGKAGFRDPDTVVKPSRRLVEICPRFQKVGGARLMAPHLRYERNRSRSFKTLIDGVNRLIADTAQA